MRFLPGLAAHVPLLALALTVSACGDDAPGEAPSTDILLERSEDLAAPTDAAATTPEPIGVGEPGGEAAGDTDLSPVSGETERPATPANTSPADAPAGGTSTGGTTSGSTTPSAPSGGTSAPSGGTTPAPPRPTTQPDVGQTTGDAAASAMWSSFRSAVSGRNTSAIARLIADPVLVDGQRTSHADFEDRVPGGDIGAFVAGFGGSLSPSQALRPAPGGGYHGLATATTEDGQEATLLFRVAPDAGGTWKVVEITPAG